MRWDFFCFWRSLRRQGCFRWRSSPVSRTPCPVSHCRRKPPRPGRPRPGRHPRYDDGPDPIYSRQLLDVLREENVKAAFFLLGEKLEGQQEIVRRMHAEGHIVGNHTYSHVDLKALSSADAMAELTETNEAIKNCIGEYPEFFRPPFGNIRKEMDKSIPMVLVSWNIDPRDWECQDAGVIVERVMENVRENGIILMHDGYGPTVEATKQIIPMLREQGYTIVSVEELLYP